MSRCFVVLGVIRLIVVRKKEERVRRKRDRVSLEEVRLMERGEVLELRGSELEGWMSRSCIEKSRTETRMEE